MSAQTDKEIIEAALYLYPRSSTVRQLTERLGEANMRIAKYEEYHCKMEEARRALWSYRGNPQAENEDGYREALGCAPGICGDRLPEEIIRESRGGQNE